MPSSSPLAAMPADTRTALALPKGEVVLCYEGGCGGGMRHGAYRRLSA